MRSDAYITVTCDECGDVHEEIQICAIAGGGWDERNVDAHLRDLGWFLEGGNDICPDCLERWKAKPQRDE